MFDVRLIASDPSAKLFYTFDPDGSPMDAYAYTGTIRIDHSTPFLYFAFTDPTNESPIYRQDYEIHYPDHAAFSVDPKTRVASFMNFSQNEKNSIALEGWKLEKDSVTLHKFEPRDFLSAGRTLSVSYVLPSDIHAYGTYRLIAPDGRIISEILVEEPESHIEEVLLPVRQYIPPESATPTRTDTDSEMAGSDGMDASGEVDSVPMIDTQDAPVETESSDSVEPLPITSSEENDTTNSESSPNTDPAMSEDPVSDTPVARDGEAPSDGPDISASARGFGGLIPLIIMFAFALFASAWRFFRKQSFIAHR
ncbi:MAG TPA: hypothetical protein PK765_05915 [bacterium]|nr:hypothetical protein [bacterium]